MRLLIWALLGWCLVSAQDVNSYDSPPPMPRRRVLQVPSCTRIPNCSQCNNAKNDDGITVVVCRGCNSGYKPNADGSACDCAPGYALDDTSSCVICEKGKYCPGTAAAAQSCGTGLTTLTSGARGIEQCVTLPGYGYAKARSTTAQGVGTTDVTATPCPEGYYNPGSNALPCRRCPGGLVTTTTGSATTKACLAGPGYLFDKLTAKPCPRGTWKSTTSAATACSRCPSGLTTPTSASSGPEQCTLALPGYRVDGPGVAAMCPRNSYNPGYNAATSCTPCEAGLVTLAAASKSQSSCLAPPGVGYDPNRTPRAATCPPNTYKAGYNRKGCASCGDGFLSAAGADAKQKCYVPTGHGTVQTGAAGTAVMKCLNGTFGYPVDTFGMPTLSCRPCPTGMATLDAKDGNSSIVNTAPTDCYTLPGYGYDKKAQAAKQCEAGSYAAGWSREPCMLCSDGYTTAAAGATDAAQCVVAARWYWDGRVGQVAPCDEGYYCLGGSLDAAAVACPNGTTTRKEGAGALADCDVCLGGYGDYTPAPACFPCPANTYNPKGSTAACTPCSINTVSAPMSDSANDCYDTWQALQKDYDFLPVSLASLMSPGTGATDIECRTSCAAASSCIFYQFDAGSTGGTSCSHYVTPAGDGGTAIGLKVDAGVYVVYPGDGNSSSIGVALRTPTSPSISDCTQECDKGEGCVAVVVRKLLSGGYSCGLKSGDMSADIKSKYKVIGSSIGNWSSIVSAAPQTNSSSSTNLNAAAVLSTTTTEVPVVVEMAVQPPPGAATYTCQDFLADEQAISTYLQSVRNAYANELGLALDQVLVSNLTCDGQSYPVPSSLMGTSSSTSNSTSGRRRYRSLLADAAPLNVATGLQLVVVSQQVADNTTSSTDSSTGGTGSTGSTNGTSSTSDTSGSTASVGSTNATQQLQQQVEAIQQQISSRSTAIVQQVLQEKFNLTAQVQQVQLLPAVAVVKVGNSTTRISLSRSSSSTSSSSSTGTSTSTMSFSAATASTGPCGGGCSLPNAVAQCGADNICRVASCQQGFSNCNFKDVDGCETTGAKCNNSIPLGLNLPSLDVVAPHYGGSWGAASSLIFLNLFKHSTVFEGQTRRKGSTGSSGWGWERPEYFKWRVDGYPASLEPPTGMEYCATARIASKAAFYEAGSYVILYDGMGSIALSGDAAATATQPNRITMQLNPSSGFEVRITETNVSDPVRNIRIIPAAAESSYNPTTDVWHPKFLQQVSGVKVLRFTTWQRIVGDERNPSMTLPLRNWTTRRTPASQTYLGKDGVSIEHMVNLANKVKADPWFSLPVAVDDNDEYANNFARYVADNLDPSLIVYIEFGNEGPGWMSQGLATHTLRLARIWRSQFKAAGVYTRRVVVVATYMNPAWIPYFQTTFGANASEVDAIAVAGGYGSVRSWNSNRPCYYEFNSANFAQDPANANITLDVVLGLARSSVIHADVMHNKWAETVRAMGKRLLAVRGGPDSQMQAAYYSARINYQTVVGCSMYPCTRSNLYPPSPQSSYTFASQAERDAVLVTLKAQADREFALEELLLQAKQREGVTKDHLLDHLSRWEAAGGDVMVVELPAATACTDGPGTRVLPPRECQTPSSITPTISPQDTPVYQALRDYLDGKPGKLAKTLNLTAVTQPQPCDPSCQWGTCVKGKCVCYAGYAGARCADKTPRPNQCNKLVGVNLEGIADYSHSWTFVDVMKSGRAWLSQDLQGGGGWGNTSGVSVDGKGWVMKLYPNQVAGTMMIRDLQGHIPAGVYTVLWDGEGVVSFSMDVDVPRYVDAGRAEVKLAPSTGGNNGLYLTVERTNPVNPVRNIRVLMPGFDAATEAAMPFHPLLVAWLKDFGVIRFMDWMATNNAVLPKTWAERPTKDQRSYSANIGGVPLEDMILLVNHVGAAPWFNMPHLGDDTYHRGFAEMVKERLRPDVNVYVEWSNEVWHTGFPGGQYAQAEGVRLNMIEQGAQWYGGATNEARLCYYAERTKNMSRIWKEVFADQANRVIVVAEGQGVWPITSDKVLSCRNSTAYIDALAIGPYFGSWSGTDTNLDTFMDTKLPSMLTQTLNDVVEHAKIAAKYNKPLLTYEAGQHLTGDNPVPMNANRDARMYALYQTYLNALVSKNVSLVTHYSSIGAYSRYGSWGLQEWMDQEPSTAHKLRAVKDFISANANATSCTLPDDSGSSSFSGLTNCPNNCSGRGTCLDGQCACYKGYSGPSCNETSYTDHTAECGYKCTFDSGVCAVTSQVGVDQYWGCTCKPMYSGLSCSIFRCQNNCSWAGTCLDHNVCACYPGFKGRFCEIDCGCNGHGMCNSDNTCACDLGYKLGPSGCEPECIGCPSGTTCISPGECGCSPSCQSGTCYNGRCECWAGYTGAACDVLAQTAPNKGSPMGMNVAGPSYWMTQWIWVDMMKSSSSWMTQNAPDTSTTGYPWDTQDNLTLGATGYPTSLPPNKLAHKLTVRNVQLHAMSGRYAALYDGDGTITFAFDAKVASVSKGRVEFDFVPTANLECQATGAAYCGDNGIHLRLTSTNPANPLRNLRIIAPGFEAVADRQVFHPWFLKSLERYSVLRFMDWMNTNSDYLPPWPQRTGPNHDTQARPGGVALEYIIRLSNELGAAPWVNVHHLADDNYVRSLAGMLKAQLRPDVKIYVEHSNEVWNGAFPQGKYATQKGKELGLSTNDYTARYIYHGKRSSEIFDIFTEVFGAAERTRRLKYVVGTWGYVCNSGTGCGITATNTTLQYGTLAQKADLVAVAGYFDCGYGSNPTQEAQLPIDTMLAQCSAKVNATKADMSTLKTLVNSFSLPMGTYEGGPSILEQSVVFSGSTGTAGAADKYIALQRDQRFQGVYAQHLAMYDELGLVNASNPFMHFTSAGLPSRYGSFGLVEYTGQRPADAPRYRAVRDVLDNKMANSTRTSCLDPGLGYRGLGDGSFFGMPAIMAPAKGATLVQGISYNLTWPASQAPIDPVTLSLFETTDCNGAEPIATSDPTTPQVVGGIAFMNFIVPDSALGTSYFLRVENSVTGQRNYSEIFRVQPLQVTGDSGCAINPRLPTGVAVPPRCPEYAWNVSTQATGNNCLFEANGCRTYRTSYKAGEWYNFGKPVYDCTATLSPNPSRVPLAAAGVTLGSVVPGAPC